jgi:hypothetical protein
VVQMAPIDVSEHDGAIFATAGVFDERAGPSRLFRLQVGPAPRGAAGPGQITYSTRSGAHLRASRSRKK